MTSRVLVSGLFVAVTCALAAPAGAQDRMQLGADSPEVAQQKRAVQTFGKVIESAVKNGGDSLAIRARTIVPELELFMDGPPVVSAVKVPDIGFVFDVQIPNVSSASIELFSLLREAPPRVRPAANGLPAPPPPTAAALMNFDVGREYGNYVRDALVDAMLLYADALPLESHERLVIVGRVPQQDALALQPETRKLVLQLLASDVLALRDGSITRDQARDRIIESRF